MDDIAKLLDAALEKKSAPADKKQEEASHAGTTDGKDAVKEGSGNAGGSSASSKSGTEAKDSDSSRKEVKKDKSRSREGSDDKSKKKKKKKSKRSRSRSRSRSKSRSRSRDRKSRRSRSRSRSRSRDRRSRRSRSRDRDRGRSGRKRSRDRKSKSREKSFEKKVETADEKLQRDLIRDQCTVSVSMLPTQATSREIATYFSQCGTIRDVQVIRDRHSQKSKGVAYVELETPDEAVRALALNGALFQGRSLVVTPTHNEKNRAGEVKRQLVAQGLAAANIKNLPSKVYVGSLHFSINEEAVRSIFSQFGVILEVNIHRDASGTSRGFGFVTFGNVADAKRAIQELNGLEVLGRQIKVGECKNDSSGNVVAADPNVPVSAGGAPAVQPPNLHGADEERIDDTNLTINAANRSLLMARLQRDPEALRQAQAQLTQMIPSATPAASAAAGSAPASTDVIQQAGLHIQTSRCLVLQHCFNAAEEDARPDNANWETEIEADVKAECEGFGRVEHCKLERATGCVYLKFEDIGGAMRARAALNGRHFGGQQIVVDYVTSSVYQKKFGI